jgi:hypothetical protein
MTISFRPAVRENVGLLIGLAGSTGSGKTFSALRLAQGIAGGKPFALIDTEARRGLHYADQFKFDHAELNPPFRPAAYTEAILAAEKAGYPVIVIDSASHEHAGEGGLLDWHEEELNRMAGDDWKRREVVKMAAWIKPKTQHKAMVQRLLQVRCHLIFCFRAEEKVEMIREDGKTKIVPKKSRIGLDGWIPICEKNLPFELTCSFLLTADKPGVPQPIKLQEQHRALFPTGEPITEAAGQRLAQWARGGTAPAPAQQQAARAAAPTGGPRRLEPPKSKAEIADWRDRFLSFLRAPPVTHESIAAWFQHNEGTLARIEELAPEDYDRIVQQKNELLIDPATGKAA